MIGTGAKRFSNFTPDASLGKESMVLSGYVSHILSDQHFLKESYKASKASNLSVRSKR